MIENTLIALVASYGQWSVLIGSFFFGESVIISSGFLSATGLWPIQNVYILALIGTIVSDSVWFLCGHLLLSKTQRLQQSSERYTRIITKIERVTGDKPFLILLFIKFLYGTRILTIVYLAHRKMRFATFVLFDFLGTIFWLGIMLGIGWLAGREIVNVLPHVRQFEYAFTILVAAAIIGKLLNLWISSRKTPKV
jgi:membrane protein DedA with SNARE-associated domain